MSFTDGWRSAASVRSIDASDLTFCVEFSKRFHIAHSARLRGGALVVDTAAAGDSVHHLTHAAHLPGH